MNSGAIMSCALAATMVESKMSMSEKFDYVLHYMKKIAGTVTTNLHIFGRVELRIFVLIFSTAPVFRKH